MFETVRVLPAGRRHLSLMIVTLGCLAPRQGTGAALPRIAVAMESSSEVALPGPLGDATAASRALAQGVREACLDHGTARSPAPTAPRCSILQDVPASLVCVDETAERALTTEIACNASDVSAEAIDLSRSGCKTSACYAVEARRAGATHLISVTASWNDGLVLTGILTAFDGSGSRALDAHDFERRYNAQWPRTGPQVLGLLKWFAREATLRVLIHQVLQAERPESQPIETLPASSPDRPLTSSHWPHWLGWTFLGGAAGAGVTSWLLWRNDKELTGCAMAAGDVDPCRHQRRTIVPAVALGVGALGALVLGSIVLLRGRSGDAILALTVHPSGVGIGGTF